MISLGLWFDVKPAKHQMVFKDNVALINPKIERRLLWVASQLNNHKLT